MIRLLAASVAALVAFGAVPANAGQVGAGGPTHVPGHPQVFASARWCVDEVTRRTVRTNLTRPVRVRYVVRQDGHVLRVKRTRAKSSRIMVRVTSGHAKSVVVLVRRHPVAAVPVRPLACS